MAVFPSAFRLAYEESVNTAIRSLILHLLAVGLSGSLDAQTFTDIGLATPSPGTNDIYQLSTQGNQTWPDGINYFTDNNPPVGQTVTTGTNAMRLVSVAIKTAGLDSGGGYGTPASTPMYYLSIYSMSNSTATLLVTVSAPNPGFTDGDWLKWSGLNVRWATNKPTLFFRQTARQRRLCGAGGGGERLCRRRNGARSHQRRHHHHRQQPQV
jgi:hypothetical protein